MVEDPSGLVATGKLDAVDWVAGIMETYGMSFQDVMSMPFRTFMALNRRAHVKGVNSRIQRKFEESLLGG